MVRTRNFVLFLLVCALLCLTIVGKEMWGAMRSAPMLAFSWGEQVSEIDYSAEVPAVSDNRAERLLALREKVKDRMGSSFSEKEEVVIEEEVVASTTKEEVIATSSETVIKTCSGYHKEMIAWTPQSINQESREGVRVYFERGEVDLVSSSTPERVRALIPLRSWPLPSATCLPTDVIGIAMDGSLMRNDELALYTVFGADTLIGYSLDGFPIYGHSEVRTDACGGAMVGGIYRYVLDKDRPGLITCFSGAPARLQ